MTQISNKPQLEDILRKNFGYKSFRPKQKEIIEYICNGNDCIVLMPTGGGKSICYQIPALVLNGLTIVVSPLIALMKDQVDSLQSNGISAAYLNSSLTYDEEQEIKEKLSQKTIRLLYVSPERIMSHGFIPYLESLNIKLFAIDEAHCISTWGHQFRPEYQRLNIFKECFPNTPVVALTATADKAVRTDIGELLKLNDPKFFITSFDRPGLSLAVLPGQKKWEQIIQFVKTHSDECGIIYCNSRASTEKLAAKLQDQGIKAACYHAGLDKEIRSKTQENFIHGTMKVICATIAFGMGIDKLNIRFIIHYNMPGNLESFYQEIGRSGRDGQAAETILFYSYRDVQTQLGFVDEIDNEQYKKIQRAKLKRMQEYAEAQVCRRKILLSYFNEIYEKDCGNCDVCKNPPQYFDGTILAQMALSAISRSKEKLGMSLLVDVLRGNFSRPVTGENFHKLKTFGCGNETSAFEWQLYIQQFIQQGIIEIDYKDHYYLKLTSLSFKVLKGKDVKLVTSGTIKERQLDQKKSIQKKPKSEIIPDEFLYEHLRLLRKSIAAKIRKPAFIVFSDVSLKDMSVKKPKKLTDFMDVHGVGEHKAKRYAEVFIKAILEFENGGG